MNLFVDTSVWSLAFRRDLPESVPETAALSRALSAGEVFCTGIVLQELLQGFSTPKASTELSAHFRAIPLLVPDRQDHEEAAHLFTTCRKKGIQTGTIDALLAYLCIRHELTMLTTDRDFFQIASISPLSVWRA